MYSSSPNLRGKSVLLPRQLHLERSPPGPFEVSSLSGVGRGRGRQNYVHETYEAVWRASRTRPCRRWGKDNFNMAPAARRSTSQRSGDSPNGTARAAVTMCSPSCDVPLFYECTCERCAVMSLGRTYRHRPRVGSRLAGSVPRPAESGGASGAKSRRLRKWCMPCIT